MIRPEASEITLFNSASEQRRKGRLGFATWLGIGLSAFAIIVGSASGGFGGVLVTAGLIALGTAIYAFTARRSSWLHLPTPRVSVASLSIAALMLTVFGSILFGATHSLVEAPVTMVTPSASPKSGAPLVAVQPEAPASVVETSAPVTRPTALAALAALAIKGRAPMTGYQRTTDFGVAWLDVDRNGCDTRNDILARDLSKLQRSGSCQVLSDVLDDPYTGQTLDFIRGNTTSTAVQIDHIVALGDAWQTGAQQLTQAQRVSLANDPLNLVAVAGFANEQKSDQNAASWLPANKGFRCKYAAFQVSVKTTYGLWVTQPEHDALARVLGSCPEQVTYASPFAPLPSTATSAPVPSADPSPVASPQPSAPVTPAPVVPAPPAAPAAPAAPVAPPAPPAPAAPANIVHPGAYCSPSGATGVTSAGTPMVCGVTANSPTRARWHQQ